MQPITVNPNTHTRTIFRTDRNGEPQEGIFGLYRVNGASNTSSGEIPSGSISRDVQSRPTLRSRDGGYVPTSSTNPRSSLELQLGLFRGLPDGASVHVLIALDDPTFDWRALGRLGADTTRRSEFLSARKRTVAAVIAPIIVRLETIGACEIKAGELSSIVSALLPVNRVAEIVTWPGVRSLHRDEPRGVLTQYGGDQARQGMRTSNFQNNGIYGYGPGRAGGMTRFAIVDLENATTSIDDWPFWNHDGYLREVAPFPFTTQTRWFAVRDCLGIPCNLFVGGPSTWPVGNPLSHANNVARVLAGSIENAFFSPYGAYDRRQRSGIATEGDLFYYRVNGTSYSLAAAVDRLIEDNIDVANLSLGVSCEPAGCRMDCDAGTTNSSIEHATDAGVLLVAAIGNDGGPGCRALYPAMNRNTLAVAGLHTTATTDYDSSMLWGSSSRGGMDVMAMSGGGVQQFAIADLSAPAFWTYSYRPGLHDFSTAEGFIGTSFASPAVAATAGLMRESFNAIGWNLNDARVLMVNMLLLGDGYQDHANARISMGVDVRSGAGRVHAHGPLDLVAPAGWGWHVARLGPGQVYTFPVWDSGPEDSDVQQWKCALTWLEPSGPGVGSTIPVADIVLEVWDTCAPGGPQSVNADYSFDIRKRISLSHSQIITTSHARCLEGRVRAFDVPINSPNPLAPMQPRTREIYVADYFHSGNPNDH